MAATFILTRIGWVGAGARPHFMRSYTNNLTACGRLAEVARPSLKTEAINSVQCGTCWRIQRKSLDER